MLEIRRHKERNVSGMNVNILVHHSAAMVGVAASLGGAAVRGCWVFSFIRRKTSSSVCRGKGVTDNPE